MKIKDNYLHIENDVSNVITDRKIKDLSFVENPTDDTLYSVIYEPTNKVIDNILNLVYSDFTLNGVVFASNEEFKTWKNINTSRNV